MRLFFFEKPASHFENGQVGRNPPMRQIPKLPVGDAGERGGAGFFFEKPASHFENGQVGRNPKSSLKRDSRLRGDCLFYLLPNTFRQFYKLVAGLVHAADQFEEHRVVLPAQGL